MNVEQNSIRALASALASQTRLSILRYCLDEKPLSVIHKYTQMTQAAVSQQVKVLEAVNLVTVTVKRGVKFVKTAFTTFTIEILPSADSPKDDPGDNVCTELDT